MRRCLLYALTSAVMLTGCAQMPGSSSEEHFPMRPARDSIKAFSLAGRIAVRHDQQQYVANITWRHAPASDEILLATPLGQGIAELSRNAGGTRLVTAERREYTAPDWQALSTQMFGFALPLELLPGWLVAAVPATALGVTYDGVGRARGMVAAKWQVAYLGYQNEAADALPSLIELQHGDTHVRLKIDDWEIPPIGRP